MASGAIEMPLGTTKNNVKFTSARGAPHICTVELFVTAINIAAYDVLLGMEFNIVVGGVYDAYIEMFTYRWTNSEGVLQSHAISAPCHVSSPPIIACACFGGLVIGEAELQDVQGVDEDTIP